MSRTTSTPLRWLAPGLLLALFLPACAGKQAPEQAPETGSLPPPARVPATPAGPGGVVDAPEEAVRIRALLDAVIRGQTQEALPYFGEQLMIGPAGWALLQKEAGDLGKKVTFVLPAAEGEVQLPGRLITSTDLPALLRLDALREACKRARRRSPRPATREERILFYRMVPHEIAGKPVTVAGEGEHRLLFWSVDGKVAHLDAIGVYKDAKQEPKDLELPPS